MKRRLASWGHRCHYLGDLPVSAHSPTTPWAPSESHGGPVRSDEWAPARMALTHPQSLSGCIFPAVTSQTCVG